MHFRHLLLIRVAVVPVARYRLRMLLRRKLNNRVAAYRRVWFVPGLLQYEVLNQVFGQPPHHLKSYFNLNTTIQAAASGTLPARSHVPTVLFLPTPTTRSFGGNSPPSLGLGGGTTYFDLNC